MHKIQNLKIKIFADGTDSKQMYELDKKDYINGFTTNLTLMRKSGITDYKKFALEILSQIRQKPISFEVFADDKKSIIRQAGKIKNWGKQIYVKIPVVNTQGKFSGKAIRELSS